MNKYMTVAEAIERGLDIHSILGVDKDTKVLNKRVVKETKAKMEQKETPQVVAIKEVVTVTMPQEDTLDIPVFLTNDYKAFKRYMEGLGLEANVDTYIYLTQRGA